MLASLKRVSFKNGEEFYRKLYFIFNAFIAISLMPFALLFLEVMHKDGSPWFDGWVRTVVIILFVVLSAGSYYLGWKNFRTGIKSALASESLFDKMKDYYESHIDKFLWYTLSSFFSIFALLLTRSYVFIVLYMFVLISLSVFRPTLNSLVKVLKLGPSDKQILTENSTIVQS